MASTDIEHTTGPALYWDHRKDRFVTSADEDYVDPGLQPEVAHKVAERSPNAYYVVRAGEWGLVLDGVEEIVDVIESTTETSPRRLAGVGSQT